jgi:hypothetical protein
MRRGGGLPGGGWGACRAERRRGWHRNGEIGPKTVLLFNIELVHSFLHSSFQRLGDAKVAAGTGGGEGAPVIVTAKTVSDSALN